MGNTTDGDEGFMKELCKLKTMFREIYRFETALKKSLGLSINEALSLCSLEGGAKESRDLAHDLGISLSRISRIIGALEEKGLVRREVNKADKRKVIFSLSPEGKKRLADLQHRKLPFPTCT